MRIFHIATVTDWEAARASGRYTTSTRGRTLAEEGFIHASRGDQWQGVRDRFYADVDEPLLLLVIDTERLTAPVVDEPVPDSAETFPHVYGALDVDAVVQTIPLGPLGPFGPRAQPSAPEAALPEVPPGAPSEVSFSRIYFEELFRNLRIAVVVLTTTVLGTLLGLAVGGDWRPHVGAAAGLVVGLVLVRLVGRVRGTPTT